MKKGYVKEFMKSIKLGKKEKNGSGVKKKKKIKQKTKNQKLINKKDSFYFYSPTLGL